MATANCSIGKPTANPKKNGYAKQDFRLPATFKTPEDIDRLIIAKLQGAKGGRGYFLANSPKNFYKQFNEMVKRGMLTEDDLPSIHLQEYALGVNVYPSYFSSIINDDVEMLCVWIDATNPPWIQLAKSPPANSSKST